MKGLIEMIRNYAPLEIGKSVMIHPLHNHGEGIIAGLAIGAGLTNIGFGVVGVELSGGLRINPKAQVMDVFGNPIPRLYAGGDAIGGILAFKYPGSGSAIAYAVCLGRIGGKNAAALAPWD